MKAAFLLLYKGYKMKLKSKINRSYKAIRNNPYVKVLVDSVRDFLDNESMNFAAAKAFYTIFSLPAFVMIVLRIGSAFYNESEVKSELFTHVETSMGSEARKTLEDILENFAFVEEDQIAAFIVIGIILFSATTVFISLQNGINHIWHIKPKKEKLKVMKNGHLLLLLLFISCGKDTSVVSGKVTDTNAVVLDSVLVQVMSTDLYTYTNKKGEFEIDTKGRGDELIFNKEGYLLGRISVDELPKNLTLVLKK